MYYRKLIHWTSAKGEKMEVSFKNKKNKNHKVVMIVNEVVVELRYVYYVT